MFTAPRCSFQIPGLGISLRTLGSGHRRIPPSMGQRAEPPGCSTPAATKDSQWIMKMPRTVVLCCGCCPLLQFDPAGRIPWVFIGTRPQFQAMAFPTAQPHVSLDQHRCVVDAKSPTIITVSFILQPVYDKAFSPEAPLPPPGPWRPGLPDRLGRFSLSPVTMLMQPLPGSLSFHRLPLVSLMVSARTIPASRRQSPAGSFLIGVF